VGVAFQIEIREQEIDRRQLMQKCESAGRRSGREHLVPLFFQIRFSQDADLILILDNHTTAMCEPLTMSNDARPAGSC